MLKKLTFVFIILVSGLVFPFLSQAQSQKYFPDRLIIKYKSDHTLSHLKAKTGVKPQNAVDKILAKNGMRNQHSLFNGRLGRRIRRSALSSVRGLSKIHEVIFSGNINPAQLAAKISKMPGVAYAEPKYIHHLFYTPNDPIKGKFIATHDFTDAWDITKGSSNVVIAIVDAGVNYLHPDLDDKLWVNQGEVPLALRPQVDANGDGHITSTEIKHWLKQNGSDYNGDGEIALDDALDPNSSFMDGADNDNNGFNDDLFGWDFWDSGSILSPVADNNPILDGSDHGTHVAGIAAAETDNDTSVAGTGFNSIYMAVKAGGTRQDRESIGYGFSGILYAAEQGADIINCSWGGSSYSQAEQDVINAATDMGSLVVAAAGNDGTDQLSYPGGYDNVVSVGSISQDQTVASYSNYGYNLDVLATGTNILSTSYGDTVVSKSGTSMATPVVSGLAALIKAVHSNWSPGHIGMQIRNTADYISDQNSNLNANKLGHGSINAFHAVDTNNLPGLKVISYQFVNSDDQKLALGEPGFVKIKIANLGSTTSNLSLQLQSLNNNGVQLNNNSQQVGSVANGDTVEVSFGLTITTDFDLSKVPTFRLDFKDNSLNYDDFNIIQYNSILYDVLAANNVKTSLAPDGTIGFTDPNNGLGGVGFIPRKPNGSGGYQEGDNLLFEGGLIMEYNGSVYDATRTNNGEESRDFVPEQVFAIRKPGDVSDADGSATFKTLSDTSQKVEINLNTYTFDNPQLSNVVFLKYTIQNQSNFKILKNMYVGLFNDWDIGNAIQNDVSYSASDSVLYVSEPNSNSPVVAVAQLGPISSVLAIDNNLTSNQDSVTFGINDDNGFTDEEKSNALRAGKAHTSVTNADVSAVNASGPYTLNPGAQITVGFVYAFGDDLGQLRTQIAAARSRDLFKVTPAGRVESTQAPQQTELVHNYPNPFNSSTEIRFDLQKPSHVTLTIYNVLGRKVRTLIDKDMDAKSYFIKFKAESLSSGVYFARLKTDNGVQTLPMTLIK